MLKEKNSKRETRRKDTHIRVVGGVLVVAAEKNPTNKDKFKPRACTHDQTHTVRERQEERTHTYM